MFVSERVLERTAIVTANRGDSLLLGDDKFRIRFSDTLCTEKRVFDPPRGFFSVMFPRKQHSSLEMKRPVDEWREAKEFNDTIGNGELLFLLRCVSLSTMLPNCLLPFSIL